MVKKHDREEKIHENAHSDLTIKSSLLDKFNYRAKGNFVYVSMLTVHRLLSFTVALPVGSAGRPV